MTIAAACFQADKLMSNSLNPCASLCTLGNSKNTPISPEPCPSLLRVKERMRLWKRNPRRNNLVEIIAAIDAISSSRFVVS